MCVSPFSSAQYTYTTLLFIPKKFRRIILSTASQTIPALVKREEITFWLCRRVFAFTWEPKSFVFRFASSRETVSILKESHSMVCTEWKGLKSQTYFTLPNFYTFYNPFIMIGERQCVEGVRPKWRKINQLKIPNWKFIFNIQQEKILKTNIFSDNTSKLQST